MVSYAVVGASRGMGLEFARQLATRSDVTVFALVRNPDTSKELSAALEGKKNVHIIQADIDNSASLQAAVKAVSAISGGTLDCLIHCAARGDPQTLMRGFADFASVEEFDAECIADFRINGLGLAHSVLAFLPLIKASAAPLRKIVAVNSGAGDLGCVRAFGIGDMAAYGISKAAGLMVATKWAVKLKEERFVVVSVNPGIIDNSHAEDDEKAQELMDDISAKVAAMASQTMAQSVRAQLKVVDGLEPAHNGLFLNYDGQELKVPGA